MSDKPQTDAKGREVFTVHPEILAGGATYRKAETSDTEPSDTEPGDDERGQAGVPAGSKEQ